MSNATAGGEGGGGVGNTSGHFFYEIPPRIVDESSNVYSNAPVTDEAHSFIPRETVFTRIHTHREQLGPLTHISAPVFRGIKRRPPAYRSITPLSGITCTENGSLVFICASG